MPEFHFSDGTIVYDFYASAKRPTLVLAHSLGVNRAMWTPLLPLLEPRWRILCFDLRGHGASSIPDEPLSVEALSCDLLALADHLHIERFSFCGVSLGGLMGQWLGVHAPERVERLFLANTAMKFGEAANWNARIALVNKSGLTPVIAGTLERWFTAEFRATEPERVEAVRAMLEGCDPAGYVAACAAVRDADFRATAARIQARTLVIAGSADPVSTPAESRALAEQIAGAEYVELPAAHLSCVERPEEFAGAMIGFASAR